MEKDNTADTMVEALENFLKNKVNWRFVLNRYGLSGPHSTIERANFVNLENNTVTLAVKGEETDDSYHETFRETRKYSLEKLKETFIFYEKLNRVDARCFECGGNVKHFYELVDAVLSYVKADNIALPAVQYIEEANKKVDSYDYGHMNGYTFDDYIEKTVALSAEEARTAIGLGIYIDAISRIEDYHGSHEDDYCKYRLTNENIEEFLDYKKRATYFRNYAYISTDYLYVDIKPEDLKKIITEELKAKAERLAEEPVIIKRKGR